jgi:tetratricopeptide (TPR) repeat protein
MLNDADILHRLRESLNSAELSAAIQRIRRVPEAWAALHDSEFLDFVLEHPDEITWTPASIADCSLLFSPSEVDKQGCEDSYRTQNTGAPTLLFQLAQEAHTLAKRTNASLDDAVEDILADPISWSSTLSCAWPHIKDTASLIERLISTQDQEVVRLVVQSLRANETRDKVLRILLELAEELAPSLPALVSQGEHELVQTIAKRIQESKSRQNDTDYATEAEAMAYAQAIGGDFDRANTILTAAWDSSMEATARIADHLAEVARSEGTLAVELEARRQAVEKACSPLRRAALARTLVENDKAFEGAQLVSQPEIVQERIASGMAALRQGLGGEAKKALLQAKDEALQLRFNDIDWLFWLAEGLETCGATTESIAIKTFLTNLLPSDSGLEVGLASLWEQVGDTANAVQHAELAYALAPDSTVVLKQLAHNLRIYGEAERALPLFEQVTQDDITARGEYCECALETQKGELAIEIAYSLIEDQPDSAHAQTLLARAHQIQGEGGLARSAIDKAIELNATEAEPWLVLAEIQAESGDIDSAGETLFQAIQVAPQEGKTHYALAQWLNHQERYHEACEHSAKAIELEPHATTWIIDHAELLARKGDLQAARCHFEDALSQQPRNWRVRESFAKVLETTGEIDRAAQLIQDPPQNLEGDSLIDSGRILVKYGVSEDPGYVQKGLALLRSADPEPDKRADHTFWLARANESLGHNQEALQLYETYLAEAETQQEHHTLEAVLGYSRVSIALNKPAQAVAFLEASRDKFPASLDLLNLLSEAHLAGGDGEAAYKIAQAATALNPISVDAHKLMSHIAEAIGDFRTAIDSEQEILSQQPENLDSWHRSARLYAAINELPAARTHMANAIQMGRHDSKVLEELASSSGEFGWQDTQLRLLKAASNLAPTRGSLQRSLAELAESAGAFETAHTAWLRCLDLEPQNPELMKCAASAVSKSGKIQSAIELWEQALEQAPEDVQTLVALAEAYNQIGDPQTSLTTFQQLLDLDVSDPRILVKIVRSELQYGDTEKATRILERIRSLDPEYRGAQLAQIEALLQKGDGQAALEIAEAMIATAPPDSYLLGLAALSAIVADDVQRARTGLDEALHETHLPREAIEVLLRVSAALGEWRVYASLLTAMMGQNSTAEIPEGQALCTLLRSRDLEWLHSQALNIRKNKPDPKVVNKYLEERFAILSGVSVESRNDLAGLLHWNEQIEAPSAIVDAEITTFSRNECQEYVQATAIGFLKANRPAKALDVLEVYSPTGLYRGYHAALTSLSALKLDQLPRAKDSAHLATKFVETRAIGSYLLNLIAQAESEPHEAITALNAALTLWPDESAWHAELAQLYAQSDRREAALPHLQQAVELDPNNQEYIISLARAYRAAGEWTQAEAYYARCLQDTPGSAHIWKEAGEVALMNGNATKAEGWFERACSLAPSDAICLMGSARAALLLGQQSLAAERAQSAYKLAPNEPQVLAGLAEILAQQGKTEKAIQAYDRALKISAGDPQVQLARSRLLMKNGQFMDAINDIKAVIGIDAEDPHAWSLLANAHEGAGKLDQALSAIDHALKLAPRSGPFRLAQGRIYRKAGQLDQALKVLRDLEIDEPENPDLPGELGQLYEARRETDTALEAYVRAVAINPQDIESCLRAGLILKGLKSYEHAAEMFERVVTARPYDAKALHQLAAVRALQLVHGGIEKQVVTT